MGPLRPKVGPCRPGMDSPKHVSCLFSLNTDSEKLRRLIVWMENGSLGQERGEISPLSSPALAAPLFIDQHL